MPWVRLRSKILLQRSQNMRVDFSEIYEGYDFGCLLKCLLQEIQLICFVYDVIAVGRPDRHHSMNGLLVMCEC